MALLPNGRVLMAGGGAADGRVTNVVDDIGKRGPYAGLGYRQAGAEGDQREVAGTHAGAGVFGQPDHQLAGAGRRAGDAAVALAQRAPRVARQQVRAAPPLKLGGRHTLGSLLGVVDQRLVGRAR